MAGYYVVIITLALTTYSISALFDREQSNNMLDKFIPPDPGCIINWIIDTEESCPWCETLFALLIHHMTKHFTPSKVYSSDWAIPFMHDSRPIDLKGNCLINWFMGTDFKELEINIDLHNTNRHVHNRKRHPDHSWSDNWSEDWFLFLEMPKKQVFYSEETADMFLKYSPRIVAVFFEISTVSASTALTFLESPIKQMEFVASCYYCAGRPLGEIWKNGSEFHDPWSTLKIAHETKDSDVTEGESPETIYFNAWRPFPLNLTITENLYHENWGWGLRCIVYIISEKHQAKYDLDKNYLSLYHLYENRWYIYDSKVNSRRFTTTVLAWDATRFVYCIAQNFGKQTNLISALLLPFDVATWTALLLAFLSVYLVSKFCLWKALNIFWLILGQPSQQTKGLLLILLSIPLIPLQSSYRDYFSSNAVIPFEKEVIDTTQKLFDSGFKLICRFGNIYSCEIQNEFKVLKNTTKLDTQNPEKYVITGNEKFAKTTEEAALAFFRDKGALPFQRKRKESTLILKASFIPGTKCHMLQEDFLVEVAVIYFDGPLSKAMYATLAMLHQSGITQFWISVTDFIESRRARKTAASNLDTSGDTEIAYMNSSIKYLFLIQAILLAINIIFFIGEILIVKLIKLWEFWKRRSAIPWEYIR